MPTYEYLCRACGNRLEVVQSFADDALTVCDGCGGELRKVFSAAGLIFKGSGWHIKDYSGTSSAPGSAGSSARPESTTSEGSGSQKDSAATTSTPAAPPAPAAPTAPAASSSGSD
jgi:putative FmdB family regulatory protein